MEGKTFNVHIHLSEIQQKIHFPHPFTPDDAFHFIPSSSFKGCEKSRTASIINSLQNTAFNLK